MDFSPGTPADYLDLLVFIIPGFVGVKLYSYFSYYEKQMSSFNTAYYSLVIGVASYLVAHLISESSGADPLWVFAATLGVAGLGAVCVGFSKRRLVNRYMVRNSAWDNFILRERGQYIRVKTADGKSVYGWLKSASADVHVNHDIVINDPFIVRGGREVILGSSMLVQSAFIASVLVLKSGSQ